MRPSLYAFLAMIAKASLSSTSMLMASYSLSWIFRSRFGAFSFLLFSRFLRCSSSNSFCLSNSATLFLTALTSGSLSRFLLSRSLYPTSAFFRYCRALGEPGFNNSSMSEWARSSSDWCSKTCGYSFYWHRTLCFRIASWELWPLPQCLHLNQGNIFFASSFYCQLCCLYLWL